MGLDPLALDGSLSDDQDGVLESLFKFGNELGLDSLDKTEKWERNVNNVNVLLLSLRDGFDFSNVSDGNVL